MKDLFQNKTFKYALIGFFVFVVIVCFLPFIFSLFDLDYSKSSQIGDTIGGFIAIGVAFLTFMAFWVQYQANEKQWSIINSDRKITNFISEFDYCKEQISSIVHDFLPDSINYSSESKMLLTEIESIVVFYELNFELNNSIDVFPKSMYYNGLEKCKHSINKIKESNSAIWLSLDPCESGSSKFFVLSGLNDSLESLIIRCNVLLEKLNSK